MGDVWAAAPEPPTKLGRHRQLAPGAGLHVSPIQLGAMSIGDKWHPYGMGTMDKEQSFALLDAFYKAGGNFVDTANVYQDETSEEFIGEWMESRGVRDQMVIATKYSLLYKRGDSFEKIPQKSQYVGNSTKSMHVSVHDSLRKLRTSYIDIFYVHFWDYNCTVEEVMNGLHHLVAQGKVLYLGVSDTPAWVVSKANNYARMAGKTPFVIYEGEWNICMRDMERDIIPMCIHEGMAIAPWNVLCAGKIRTDAEEERRMKSGEGGRTMLQFDGWLRNETERKASRALEKVAGELGAKSITAVAIAYLMQKYPYVFPIVGGRKIEHLHANLEALDIALSPEQMKFLNDTVPFNKGFPYLLFGDGSEYNVVYNAAGHFDKWPAQQAIRPQKLAL